MMQSEDPWPEGAKRDAYGANKKISMALDVIPIGILNGRVLDLGCGVGAYSMSLASLTENLISVDVNEQFLLGLGRHHKVNRVTMNAQTLGIKSDAIDLVVFSEVIEHVDNDLGVLKDIYRVVKPGGFLILSAPNQGFPFETHGIKIGKFENKGLVPFFSWAPQSVRKKYERARIYSREEIEKLVLSVGFTIIAVKYMMPPLDKMKNKSIKEFGRQIALGLESSPTFSKFGVSIILVCQKSK